MGQIVASLLACILMVSAGLSGAAAAGERRPAAALVTLRWGAWMTEQAPALQKIAAEFEASHPRIKIDLEFTSFPTYWSTRLSEAKRHTLPDVFAMNVPSFPYYASHGLLMPLDQDRKSVV